MVEKDFDFKQIGKQLPYRVPDGFFEKMQGQVMECIQEEKHRKQHWIRLVVPATFIAAAVWLGILFFPVFSPETERLPSETLIVSTALDCPYSDVMDQYIEAMSDEELAEWVELSENDIFIND